ncbi:MAG TPA: protease HtpX [Xanthomonadaceae bacterium]|nr:protease HtpX [Xanthomonadaceae bacterium]
MMTRIALFLGTNIAVLFVLTVVMKLLGVDVYLASTGQDMTALLIFAAVLGFAGSLISLALSKTMAKAATRAQVIKDPRGDTERWLYDTVARQAKAAGIGMPEVAIYDAPEPNAFATGMNRNNALVAVSTGLLRGMNRDEVEAVLGHEVAHVANGDMVTMTLLQGVLNTFVIFLSRILGRIVDQVVFRNERGTGPGYWITVVVLQILLGILASMIVMAFSRWREFRADAGGARLAGRQKMIAALKRLAASSGQSTLPEQVEAFGISGRFGGGLKKLFMSHPPLSTRIAALEQAQG